MEKQFRGFLTFVLALSICMSAVGFFCTPAKAISSKSDAYSKTYDLSGSAQDKIVAVAYAQLNKRYGSLYGDPWCAAFVSDCAKLAGLSDIIPFRGGVSGETYGLRDAVMRVGGVQLNSNDYPQKGDLIFYCSSAGTFLHVGIVAKDSSYTVSKINSSGTGLIVTIEGNVSGAVMELTGTKVYKNGSVVGPNGLKAIFVRPKYCTHKYETVKIDGEWVAQCTNCKTKYNYLLSFDSSAAGTYAISSTNARFCPAPYSDSKLTICPASPVKIDGSVINAYGNTWYRVTNTNYYLYSGWVTKTATSSPTTSALRISPSQTTYTINKGSKIYIRGTITSNYNITSYSSTIDGNTYYSPSTVTGINSTSVNIFTSRINEDLHGATLSAGTHTLRITATDSSGKSVSQNITIQVNGTVTQCATPTIDYVDIPGGKRVTITQNTAGATLEYHYWESGNNNSVTTNNSVTFNLYQSDTVTAYSRKSGLTTSAQARREIQVSQLSAPAINASMTGTGANITITGPAAATLYYSLDGNHYQKYEAPFSLTSNATVYAYAARNGYINSGAASRSIVMEAPDVPSVVLSTTSTKVAQGSTIMVSWGALSNALDYTVKAYKDGSLMETKSNITDTSATFLLDDAASYYFLVSAHNNFGTSADRKSSTVTTIAPLTVKFVDWDGMVLSEQEVAYGRAATAPPDPERKGYTFRSWKQSFSSITEDLVIETNYQINTYTVTFQDHMGNRIGSAQKITYGSGATPPGTNSLSGPSDGYSFVDWSISADDPASSCDLDFVDSNLTARAVFAWTDEENPVIITSLEAEYDPDVDTGKYAVKVVLENTDAHFTRATLRVALKTTDADTGVMKMVDTESLTVALLARSKNNVYNFEMIYPGTASTVEAFVTGYEYSTLTGPSYSVAKTATVKTIAEYDYGPYSEWSTINPTSKEAHPNWDASGSTIYNEAGREVEVESKVQYGYRTRSTTTSTSSAMAGWILDSSKTTTNYTDWANVGWTRYYPTPSNTLRITDTKTVTDSNAYTVYNYYHYYGYRSSDKALMNSYGNSYWKNYESTSSTSQFPYYKTYDSNYPAYKQTVSGMHGNLWWLGSTTTVPATTHTEWWYQTRSAYNVYTFYRDSDNITSWEDTLSANTATKIYAYSRTVYRYRVKDQAVIGEVSTANEDSSGSTYVFTNIEDSGAKNYYYVPAALPGADKIDLNGKVATVMVYRGKNSDPNESQIQYVGQIVIGENNTFRVDFIPKIEPDENTGDFIVAMSVQGSVGLVNIGLIQAPLEHYTITYTDEAGNVIETQDVVEGSNAVPPEAPAVEGKTFIMWSESGTNIHSDMTITAKYIPNTYAVVFVDFVNQTVVPFVCEYGASLAELAAGLDTPEAEGHTFAGWDFEDDALVTENTVVTAMYDPDQFTVKFYDNGSQKRGTDDVEYTEHEVISTQTVSYGQSAELPEAPEIDGMTFLGWSTDVEWWNVKADMDVYPIYIYDDTAQMPNSDVGGEYTGENVTINLTTEDGGTIYYTTDGSDPDSSSEEYTGPITLDDSTVVRAITITPGKNDSEILEIYFEYSDVYYHDDSIQDSVAIGTYNVAAEAGKETTIQMKIDDNPGLVAYLFTVECDRSVFYVDYDEETGFVCNAGDVSNGGMMFCTPYGDTGWQILWFSETASSGTGELFSLTLKTSDEAEAGTYPVKISYSPMNTVTSDEVEAEADSVSVVFGGSTGLFGDVNGDGVITTVDVVRIARFIIDDLALTRQQQSMADVTGDGKITAADVIRLAKFIVGLAELG